MTIAHATLIDRLYARRLKKRDDKLFRYITTISDERLRRMFPNENFRREYEQCNKERYILLAMKLRLIRMRFRLDDRRMRGKFSWNPLSDNRREARLVLRQMQVVEAEVQIAERLSKLLPSDDYMTTQLMQHHEKLADLHNELALLGIQV